MSEGLEPLTIFVKALEDPKGKIYLILIEHRRQPGPPAVSRKTILAMTRIHEATVDRSLRWLVKKGLIDKYQGRQEVYYYATA